MVFTCTFRMGDQEVQHEENIYSLSHKVQVHVNGR